jgi:hypothetical protein
MRLMPSIAAAFLIAAAVPAAGHADGMPPGCHCPQAVGHHVWHPRRIFHHRAAMARHRAWHHRPGFAPPLPIYFTWVIPSSVNPGYDRALVLYGRSPAVSGIYTDDPGAPVTPMVAGDASSQNATGGAVFQYDTTTGDYIQLSREDAARAAPVPGAVSPR